MSGTTGQSRATPTTSPRRSARMRWAVGVTIVGTVFAALFVVFARANGSTGHPGSYATGQPGIGFEAPGFRLAASTGQQVDLASFRGRTVLLYFQEGLTCQPCWDQIADLDKVADRLSAAGVDQVLSITTDPVDLITRKAHDEGLLTPVLSDPDLAVSRMYHANSYGMMGTSRDGHSFVLVGPDGHIQWRADYGGAPKYTMYVPPDTLLADLTAGRRTSAS